MSSTSLPHSGVLAQGCGWGRLQSVGASSDVGIGPLCARWLSLIHTDEFPVPLPPGERLHQMFVVGTRVRPCPPASYPMRPFSDDERV